MFRGDCHQSNTITNYHIWWGISIYLAFFTQISRPSASLDTPKMQASLEYLYVLRLWYNIYCFTVCRPISLETNGHHYQGPWMDATCVRSANSFVTKRWLSQEQNELFWEYLMGLKIASSYKFISCIYGWNKAHVGTGQGQELLKSSNVH